MGTHFFCPYISSMPNHKRSNASRPVIIVIFDDLYTGGAFTIIKRLFAALSGYRFIVVVGVAPGQTIDPHLFSYAERIVSYPLPETSEVPRFVHIARATSAALSSLQKQYDIACIVGNVAVSAFAGKLYALRHALPFVSIFHGAQYLERRSTMQQSHNVMRTAKNALMIAWNWCMQYMTLLGTPVGCFSTYAEEQLRTAFHIGQVQVLTVPAAYTPVSQTQKRVARERLGIAATTRLLIVPSRIEPRKGQHLVLEALSYVPKSLPVTVVCIGSVSPLSFDYLERLFKIDVPFYSSAYFVGEKRYEDLRLWYEAADLTIMSSTDLETFGMVTLESLSYGVPVIGFKTGATKELLKPFPELYSARVSSQALADAIRRYFVWSPVKKRRLISRIASTLVKTHTIDAAKRSFDALIDGARQRKTV